MMTVLIYQQTNHQPAFPTSIRASLTTHISHLTFIPRARLNGQFPVSFQAHVKLCHRMHIHICASHTCIMTYG